MVREGIGAGAYSPARSSLQDTITEAGDHHPADSEVDSAASVASEEVRSAEAVQAEAGRQKPERAVR